MGLTRNIDVDIWQLKRLHCARQIPTQPPAAGFVSAYEWVSGFYKFCCEPYARACFLLAVVESRAENAPDARRKRLRVIWKILRRIAENSRAELNAFFE